MANETNSEPKYEKMVLDTYIKTEIYLERPMVFRKKGNTIGFVYLDMQKTPKARTKEEDKT
ncbi:MAG: hypothetical protein KAJ75_06900 [Alphaproteobacteria bacterium]|nr:hypothetical protein [Alphaproteobacteria bacterium]